MKTLMVILTMVLFMSCSKNPFESIPDMQEFVVEAIYTDSLYNMFTGDRDTWTNGHKNIDFDKSIVLNRIVLSAKRPHTFAGDGLYEFSIGKNDNGSWIETRTKAPGISPLGDLDVTVFTDCMFRYENGISIDDLYWQIKTPNDSGGMHVYVTVYLLAYPK